MKWFPARFSPFQATVFLLGLVAAFATRLPALVGVFALMAGALLLTNVRAFGDTRRKERIAVMLVLAVLTVMLPVSAWRNPTAILHYPVALLSLATAVVLSRNLHVYLQASRYSLLIVQGWIGVYLWRSGIVGDPLAAILPDSSGNGITSYLILLQANYVIINYQVTQRASLLTAGVTVLICIVGVGRGSILASGALAAVCVLSCFSMKSYVRLVLSGLLLVALGMVYSSSSEAIAEVLGRTKVGAGLYDSTRHEMITEYCRKLDLGSIWTGASYEGTVIAEIYNGNPHNSFIRAHHIFGLPYLMLMLILPLYLIHRDQPRSVKLFAAGIWMVVLFRSFTEPILFPTLLDFLYFATCLTLSRTGQPNSAMPATTQKL